MIYKWKQNRYPVSAQEAGEFLTVIEREVGCLTPTIVLNKSREDTDLLHPCFEWQDALAAEEYRKNQASGILRNLVLIKTEENEEKKPIRAFLHVEVESKGKKESVYLLAEKAMSDAGHKSFVLQEAMRELLAFRNKYENLRELANELSVVFSAINAAEEQLNLSI